MLIYVSNLDLSFRKAGEKITYTKGDKIDPSHEHFVLTHYAGRVRSSSGGSGAIHPSFQDNLGVTPSPTVNQVLTPPRENLGGLTGEIAKQGKKLDKIMDSIETLSQGTTTPISVTSAVQPEAIAPPVPKPEIKEIVLDSVVKTDGIEASGKSGDNRSEGEDIEKKLEKLRDLKGSKKKKQKKEKDGD